MRPTELLLYFFVCIDILCNFVLLTREMMEDTRLKLLPLLEHIIQSAKRVAATHSPMSRNSAIMWFIEECAFIEERLLFLYSEWKIKLPLYEDKDVDYDEWIKKLENIFSSSNVDMKTKNFPFTYLARKLGATKLRGKNIQKLYSEQVYVRNGFDSDFLQTIEHLHSTVLSYSLCANALASIVEVLKEIKHLFIFPTHEQYLELGRELITKHLYKTGGKRNSELETNTPSDEYFSVMDSEIKRIHEFYKVKGLSGLWLKKMDQRTIQLNPAVVGQILFSMRSKWNELEAKQFVEDYCYIVLMNCRKRKIKFDLDKLDILQERSSFQLSFRERDLDKLLSQNIDADCLYGKLKEVCSKIKDFKCHDYEFVYVIYVILENRRILVSQASKNAFFKAFSPSEIKIKKESWNTNGRKMEYSYKDFVNKNIPVSAPKNPKNPKYSNESILYDTFGKLLQLLPLLVDVEKI